MIDYRKLLDGLNKRGFRTNMGPDGTGAYIMAWERGGGYYLGIFLYQPLDKGCE